MIKKILCAFCLFSFVSTPAFADAVTDKLDSLDKIVKDFQADSITRNEKVAAALALIEQLKHDVLAAQGRIDANNHIIREQQKDMLRLKRDLSERMLSMEDRLEIYDIQISRALAKVVPAAVGETEAYQKALDLVQKSDFLTAVASFRRFLKSHSRSELADNAQFWVGECYFAMRDYEKAIKEFQLLVERYPGSDKTKTALLKQGLSFAELQMKDEAAIFLNKVIKDYPGTDEAARAREKLDKQGQKDESFQTAPLRSPAEVHNPELIEGDANFSIPLAPGVKNQPKKPAEAPERTKGKD